MRYRVLIVLFLLTALSVRLLGALGEGQLDGEPRRAYDVTISFSGDAMVHTPQITTARTSDGGLDFRRSFVDIAPYWKSVDFAVVNFETTISADGAFTGYPMFKSPLQFAEALSEAGIDVAALANNHICDRGATGLDNTVLQLNKLGLKTYGAAINEQADTVLYLEKYPFKVAMLNYTYGTNGMPVPKGRVVHLIDTALIAQHIKEAQNNEATHIVVFYHWGNEYQLKSNKWQQELALWSRQKGADVVIGSHPHVVQEVDYHNFIVYSLGNLVSNQQYKHTDIGQTAVITLTNQTKPSIEMITHINTVKEKRPNDRHIVKVFKKF